MSFRESLVAANRQSSRIPAAGLSLEQNVLDALHDGLLAMNRTIPVPVPARNVFYGMSSRRTNFMGAYPAVAFAFARHEAPWSDVTAPMDTLRSLLWHGFYVSRLPSLHDAQQRETEAQGRLDVWQLIVSEYPTPENCASMQFALGEHISALRVLRAVTESICHKAAR